MSNDWKKIVRLVHSKFPLISKIDDSTLNIVFSDIDDSIEVQVSNTSIAVHEDIIYEN